MKIYLAPLEGITSFIYRRAVHDIFGDDYDAYFTPFISPRPKIGLQSKERRDLLPENNKGLNVIPQILSCNPEHFASLANDIHDSFGYEEINLNCGCPSKTVVSRGRGSGMLKDPDELCRFLDTAFAKSKVRISVKTRLGISDTEEFNDLLKVYNQFPLTELIIHARVMTDYYKLPVRTGEISDMIKECRMPVIYNGDIYKKDDCNDKLNEIGNPANVSGVMLGRGAISNPALAREINGGEPASQKEMRVFHDRLMIEYTEIFGGGTPLLFHMKELWSFMGAMYPDKEKALKQIRKATDMPKYLAAVHEII